jgi:hypothetical protein
MSRALIDVRRGKQGFVPECAERIGKLVCQREIRLASGEGALRLLELLGTGVNKTFFELAPPNLGEEALGFPERLLRPADFAFASEVSRCRTSR